VRLFLDTPDGFGEKNYHVDGGNSRFVEALAAHLEPGQVVTEARVTAIEQDAAGVRLRVLVEDERYVEVTGRMAVVTVPVSHIGRIQFSPPLPAPAQEAIRTTRMGSYIKVHFRTAPGASRLWSRDGENLLTLLSDSPAGSIYDVSDLQSADGAELEGVVTLLLHARFARDLVGESADVICERSADALDALFPGARPLLGACEVFVYPQAVAYWPLAQGRSRFDDLANALRKPHGRLYIGGDTTEDSHSEGAVVAAQRIAKDIVRRRAELE
jgi:monoamine oxidase